VTPESRTVRGRDAELFALRWGDHRESVVLGHGLGFVGATWRVVAERLAERYTVVAFDRRHHGRSRGETCDYAGHAQDVLDVVDAFGLDEVFGIAHSIGATDLLLAAGARPSAFAKLFVIEPTVRDPLVPADPDPSLSVLFRAVTDRTAARPPAFPGWAQARARLSRAHPSWHPDVFEAYLEYGFEERADGTVAARCPPPVEAAMLESIFRVMENKYQGSDFEVLPNVTCPVSVVSGGRSEGIYEGMADIAARRVARGTRHQVPHGTHFWALQHPEELLAQVEVFDRSLKPG
jgi:pimeloyl-ACP methyl ester carboxylesterase